jgi:hypothetical protein
VHPEPFGDEARDSVSLGHPEGDVVECVRPHAGRIASHYFLPSTARWSCCLFILERPRMFIRLASL